MSPFIHIVIQIQTYITTDSFFVPQILITLVLFHVLLDMIGYIINKCAVIREHVCVCVQVDVPISFSTGESVLVTFSGQGVDPLSLPSDQQPSLSPQVCLHHVLQHIIVHSLYMFPNKVCLQV